MDRPVKVSFATADVVHATQQSPMRNTRWTDPNRFTRFDMAIEPGSSDRLTVRRMILSIPRTGPVSNDRHRHDKSSDQLPNAREVCRVLTRITPPCNSYARSAV